MRLAKALGLEFVDLLCKNGRRQQKEMENSEHQCRNALDSFSVSFDVKIPEKVLLVDDVVDSKWTFPLVGPKTY